MKLAPLAFRIRRLARTRLGLARLRPGQLDAVKALSKGRDVLVVMPTGAGKSAVYQLAGLMLDGPTVVVSPLIALQRDQLEGLAKHGENAGLGAVAVNSAQSRGVTDDAWDSLTAGDAEFMFLAPEQLANATVLEKLSKLNVSLLAVDEAHCVSAWGHDFRPHYLRIGDVIEALGRPRVVALTATASPPVRAEIVERLKMNDPVRIVTGFDRPNLELEVRRFVEARHKEKGVIERVASLEGSGLVYTATRRSTEEYAEKLREAGRTARAYHAGMKAAEREEVHAGFLDGEIDVVVATSAFGMGINKADVRFVVHADVPDSIDSYYQEIGRAGRDGEPALICLYYRPEDLSLRKFFASGGPDEEVLTQVAGAVREHTEAGGSVGATQLREELDLSATKLTGAINLLEQAGAVKMEDDSRLAYTDVAVPAAAAVVAAAEVDAEHTRMDRSRVEMMRGYAETTGCRREFLLGYFGEELVLPEGQEGCGNCDTCRSGLAAESTEPDEDAVPLPAGAVRFDTNDRVRHREWGPGVVMRDESDRITVLFEQVGYRTLALAVIAADAELLVHED
ncbi:RecQ family ATP-dependent DNA helicase [Kineosporia sp. NBRC 101731]|uniref:RecQ family ATP-dependent DNA helicase n=1 Tax=Kineosporia sp. NBRC 101731 TaxID=3032199 RepID=UPI0024A4F6D7|nr:RecQ family ATP-dependent DNA helicase [Kineosporia sp. NBRC 101731]GLY33023.1 ATP-dependent DNA helicase RecQ [Kineosporia sp. NBRC 101731]